MSTTTSGPPPARTRSLATLRVALRRTAARIGQAVRAAHRAGVSF